MVIAYVKKYTTNNKYVVTCVGFNDTVQ